MQRKFFLALLSLILAIALFLSFNIYLHLHKPLNSSENPFLVVKKGSSATTVLEQLQDQKIVSNIFYSKLWVDITALQIKAGVYDLRVNNLQDLLKNLQQGKQAHLQITFIEGKTFKDIRKLLQNQPYLTHQIDNLTDTQVAKALNTPNGFIEGWLAPDTYNFIPFSSDLDLLKRSFDQQLQILQNAWQDKTQNLTIKNPSDLLTLASIIEKETGLDNERTLVSSVFHNRLKHRWRLQSDPTVIYGLGNKFTGTITKKHLKDKNAFNTYVIKALPPSAIAMPSKKSIFAAANPDESNYFYFVANGQGGHKFSKTLKQHNQAVKDWIKNKKTKNEKSR